VGTGYIFAERSECMKFKLWCIANGYTARKIEELTGIRKQNIFNYWQGVRTPTRATEKILQDKLGMPSGMFG
jgi:transcriptional regulator with XRE-family HTH domain